MLAPGLLLHSARGLAESYILVSCSDNNSVSKGPILSYVNVEEFTSRLAQNVQPTINIMTQGNVSNAVTAESNVIYSFRSSSSAVQRRMVVIHSLNGKG